MPPGIRKLLVRSTNWIGDAIMTTPAVRSIRRNFPDSEITMLVLPWVADVFRSSPRVDRLILYDRQGRHGGVRGKLTLAGELRAEGFDAAILLQNAFEAAFITLLARIPVRAGYTTDGRGLLLTHGVRKKPEISSRHQVNYYQEMLRGLGLAPGGNELELTLPGESVQWAGRFLQEQVGNAQGCRVVGLNPGAAYGPAKRWPADKFARLAQRLSDSRDTMLLVFGTEADSRAAGQIAAAAGPRVVDLTGRTSLAQAMALIGRCDVFVTNDSGLMHIAAALDTPTVAVFGSTNPVTTGPYSARASVVRSEIACSPCLETHCPEKHFQCMEQIGVDDVARAVERQLAEGVSYA